MWLAVETAIMSWMPSTPFHLARILHGVMGQHDVNPRSIPTFTLARRLRAALSDHHPPCPGTVEAVVACWGAVYVPEGWNPVQWAVKRYRWVKRPRRAPGCYLTPEQRDLATLLWHVFTYLPPDDEWAVYGSVRELARHAGSNKDYVALTLRQMVSNGLIEIARPHTQATATRYLLRHCPIDR